MTQLKLNWRERRTLTHLLKQTQDATTLRRAQALVWLDQGESVAQVAARLYVSRQVIYQWIAIFHQDSTADMATRLAAGARSGRPRTVQGVIDALVEEVIDHDPRLFGYNSTVWTAPLLAEYLHQQQNLSVSIQSIRLAIARLDRAWKRPRHHLALRSPTWRQAKGGLKRWFKKGLYNRERTVILMLDEIIVTETPPLYNCYGRRGEPVWVPITGNRAKRILHGAINIGSGDVALLVSTTWDKETHQTFLRLIRAHWRGWNIVLFEDRGSPHTASESRALAAHLNLEIRLLPRATPELNAMDHLWRSVKGRGIANQPTLAIDASADAACQYILDLRSRERLQKAGILSGRFWLTT